MPDQHDPKTFAIIGTAMDIHKELGFGFLEAVYEEALTLEFGDRSIPFERQVDLAVEYKGRRLKTSYRADFVCYSSIIVELKAMDKLCGLEQAQILNYLKATGYRVGLLLNFGTRSLEYRRLIFGPPEKSAAAPP
jgi:GxxExxY protein